MPWKGNEPVHDPRDPAVAAATQDLVALHDAAGAAHESIGALLAALPRWLSADEAAKLGSIRNVCDVLSGSTERALRVLRRPTGS